MFRFSKWIAVPVLGAALCLGSGASTAEAGNGFSIQVGGPSFGYGGFYGSAYRSYRPPFNSGFGYGYGGFYPPIHYGQYHSFRGGRYNHPHLDYHRPSLVPHRSHFHYVPGHFDIHRGIHRHRGHR